MYVVGMQVINSVCEVSKLAVETYMLNDTVMYIHTYVRTYLTA